MYYLKEMLIKVIKFQKAFDQPVNEKPTMFSQKDAELRHALMSEENDEFLEAVAKNDLTGILDSLGDQLYVLLGTINEFGGQHIIEDAFVEIHRSNMSKLGEDGKVIKAPNGKVLKGNHYFKPNLKQFIDEN
jgi:predicted HAD superfamily Cof-like phosphohydrolase